MEEPELTELEKHEKAREWLLGIYKSEPGGMLSFAMLKMHLQSGRIHYPFKDQLSRSLGLVNNDLLNLSLIERVGDVTSGFCKVTDKGFKFKSFEDERSKEAQEHSHRIEFENLQKENLVAVTAQAKQAMADAAEALSISRESLQVSQRSEKTARKALLTNWVMVLATFLAVVLGWFLAKSCG